MRIEGQGNSRKGEIIVYKWSRLSPNPRHGPQLKSAKAAASGASGGADGGMPAEWTPEEELVLTKAASKVI